MSVNGWKEVVLNEVVDKLGDGLHGTPKYDDNGDYYFVNGNNLQGEIVFNEKTKKVDEVEYQKYKKDLNNTTLLVSINGTLGNVATYNGEKIILGKSACYFNVSENVDKNFIKYIIISDFFKEYIQGYSTGTTIKNIGLKQMRNFKFFLPPLQEQKAIAATLSCLDDKIELNNRMNQTLEEMAQAIFKSWFVDFEPFQDGEFVDSELGRIPKGWRVGELGEFLENIKASVKANPNINGVPYVPIDTISKYSLGLRDFKSGKEAKSSLISFLKDDILIGAMRVYFHKVAIAPFDGITRTTCFVLRSKQSFFLSYSLLLCNTDDLIEYANKTSKGSTMPYAIWKGGIQQYKIVIPTNDVLQKFHYLLYPVLVKIRDGLFENQKLKQLRNTLLPKLMSGEVRVPIPEAE